MIRPRQYARLLGLAGALCALVLPSTTRAQVAVTPTVTSSGGLFTYDYTITNNTRLDLVLVTIPTVSAPGAVRNLTAPAGFLASFDPDLGLVDFIEGTQAFTAGRTFSGFRFDSPIGPAASQFTALNVQGNELRGATLAPVPEPGSLALGLTLAPGLILVSLRRRKLLRKGEGKKT